MTYLWPTRSFASLRKICRAPALAVAACAFAAWPAATAQDAFPEPERCPRFIAHGPAVLPLIKASVRLSQDTGRTVSVAYEGHSTFLIQSPAGVTIATDYNDAVRLPLVPTIATMNIAHISHYSVAPDPAIPYVLPGWGDDAPAHYDLTVRDVWLRNVTTNIRSGGFGFDGDGGGEGGVRRDTNSIFVFEVAGLCIAHLGHLHQRLTPDHLDALGRIDVVLVPVDGGRTLSVQSMLDVLRDIQAPVVIPMHWFGQATLGRFIAALEETYAVEYSDVSSVDLSRETLPRLPTMIVLPPG